MKNLKDFAGYIKASCLRPYAVEYLRIIMSLEIPLVKLVIERNIFPGIDGEKGIEMTMLSQQKFLSSIEDGTCYENARKSIKDWQAGKINVPGLSQNDINPTDLVLVYAAQRQALLAFLPSYCSNARDATKVISELENYYMTVQKDAVKVMFDIQKETEAKLKEREETFRLVVQAVRDYAIYLLDEKGYIKSWNEGVQRIKGYTAEEIIGKHYSLFFTEEDKKKGIPELNLEMAVRNGHYESEGIRLRKDGTRFWVNSVITPLYDEKRNLKGFSKVTRDITEIKRAKEELEHKAQELGRSNTELEQFAYVASHDLQEPLRTVSSYVQLLSNRYKGKLDKDADDFIRYAVDGNNRMRQLINSLLEYSRINRVKPFEKINLAYTLNEILSDLDTQVKSSGAIFKFKDLPEIYGDEVLIGQLFQNLIGNALKFKGNKRPEIIISGEKRNGYSQFSVRDNGIGIQKEYWDKVFVIFQRLNNREDYPGTGIGLSICKKIVERHGGKIWVESEPDKGSCFYFTIKDMEKTQPNGKMQANAKENKHIVN